MVGSRYHNQYSDRNIKSSVIKVSVVDKTRVLVKLHKQIGCKYVSVRLKYGSVTCVLIIKIAT